MSNLILANNESCNILVEDLSQLEIANLQAWKNKIIWGNCLEILRQIPAETVDLIVTSPPYADSRKNTYGGIHPDHYVNWLLPISLELQRVLKPEGTFILNIKEKVVNGQRHNYVIQLILEMQKRGWLWTEEYIWHKKNCYPGKWSNRFRDAWERCLQFNKQKKFKMYQESVMVPMGDWANSRLKNLSETDKRRDSSKVESGFGKNISNWLGRDKAYPTNVLHLATECGNKRHSAAFPKSLPSWFIKLFTAQNDIVLDPFLGSGTTCVSAKELGRNFIGIEIEQEYCNLALSNINAAKENSQIIESSNTAIDLNNHRLKENYMTDSAYQLYYDYLVQHVLSPFYQKRFDKLRELQLKKILKLKNPYLFKAKNIELAQEFVKSIVDAFLSSQEETIFGDLLEKFAIYVSQTLDQGFKSTLKSVDLEFEREDIYYIVGIKSGTNWGNSDQVNKMKENFKKAKQLLRQKGCISEIIAVNGCMYGRDNNSFKKDEDLDKAYYKYAGQAFWSFLSKDENLYQEIIVPIDIEAKKKDEVFKATYNAKINEMTSEFMRYFMTNHQIDWVKLVNFVSGREEVDFGVKQMILDFGDDLTDSEQVSDLNDLLNIEE